MGCQWCHVYHSLISLFSNTSCFGTAETSQAECSCFPSWCMNDSSISVYLSSECQVPLKETPFSDDWWRPVNNWKWSGGVKVESGSKRKKVNPVKKNAVIVINSVKMYNPDIMVVLTSLLLTHTVVLYFYTVIFLYCFYLGTNGNKKNIQCVHIKCVCMCIATVYVWG